MKIDHTRIIHETLELSEDQVNKITMARLEELLDGGNHLFRDNLGKCWLMRTELNQEIVIRKATDQDRWVNRILFVLKYSKSKN